MADLTFADLQALADIEPNTFVIGANGSVMIDVSQLINEDVTSLTAEKVTETAFKLLAFARLAQTQYNTGKAAGTRIASISAMSDSLTADRTGVNSTISVTAYRPISPNDIAAPLN